MLLLSGLCYQPVAGQTAPYFDGREAYALLQAQTDLGPRYPGSPGHAAMADFLEEYLRPLAHELTIQTVRQPHPYR
ncbi:MAG: hypothetical protein V3W14_02095, partial [Candidatus Neomarinimicrobiota bacterium]